MDLSGDESPEFQDALSVHPVSSPEQMYHLHRYFTERELQKTYEEIKKLQVKVSSFFFFFIFLSVMTGSVTRSFIFFLFHLDYSCYVIELLSIVYLLLYLRFRPYIALDHFFSCYYGPYLNTRDLSMREKQTISKLRKEWRMYTVRAIAQTLCNASIAI